MNLLKNHSILALTIVIASSIVQITLVNILPGSNDNVFGLKSWGLILLLIPVSLGANIYAISLKKFRMLSIVFLFPNVLLNLFWLLCIGGIGV